MPPRKPKTPAPTPAPRQRTRKAPPVVQDATPADPVDTARTEVYAALGDTSFKIECPLHMASAVALRLHAELEKVVRARPECGPIVQDLHGGALDVSEAEYYEEGVKRTRPPNIGFV